MRGSLTNMANSVDWSKLVSGSDARNAAVGAALGGLLLGGASAAQDRDPEESKYTAVKDGLLGMVLGGTAAYGIPKGISMFRDSGTLAPDSDQLTGGAGSAMARGAVAGGAIGLGTAIPELGRATWEVLLNRAEHGVPLKDSYIDILRAVGRGEPLPQIRRNANAWQRIAHFLRKQVHGEQFDEKVIRVPIRALHNRIRIPQYMRILGKGGRYAAAGAGLAWLGNRIFGNSARGNFKN